MNSKIFKIIIRIITIISFIMLLFLRGQIYWYEYGINENNVLITGITSIVFSWLILETIGKILHNTETIIEQQKKLNEQQIQQNPQSNESAIKKVIDERFPNSNYKDYK